MAEDKDKDKAKDKGSGGLSLLVIIVLFMGFAAYQREMSPSVSETPVPADSTFDDSPNYTGSADKFSFSYNSTVWTPHERPNQVILLKSKEFPDIQSEVYALGEYIIVGKHALVGAYEKPIPAYQFIQTLSTEENMFEGKPTKVVWETHANVPMLRVEHVNTNAPHTVNYYAFTGDGKSYYQLSFHPYNPGDAASTEYADFIQVVNSFAPHASIIAPANS